MKKAICFVLVFLFCMTAHAKPFPTLKSYVVNGVAIAEDWSYEDIQRHFGKPARSKKINNECAQTTDIYYYYPSVTFKDSGRVDEIFFSNPKNQIRFATMNIDANTTAESIKKLGNPEQLLVTTEKGVTSYRLEDKNDPSAWIFDFKGTRLYRASFFSDDC